MRHTAQEALKLVIQQINELTKIYHNAVSSHHISENEFWIWYILILTDGEHSQQSICDAWSLTKQTINTIIGNMVRDGYAILVPIPGTKNRKSIHLTEQGRQHGEQIVLPIAYAEQRALGRIRAKELAACTSALRKLTQFLKEEISHAESESNSEG